MIKWRQTVNQTSLRIPFFSRIMRNILGKNMRQVSFSTITASTHYMNGFNFEMTTHVFFHNCHHMTHHFVDRSTFYLKHVHIECHIFMNMIKAYYHSIFHEINNKPFSKMPFGHSAIKTLKCCQFIIFFQFGQMLPAVRIHHITYTPFHIPGLIVSE